MEEDRLRVQRISLGPYPGPIPEFPSIEEINRLMESPAWQFIQWSCQDRCQACLEQLLNGSTQDERLRGAILTYNEIVNAPVDMLNEPRFKEPENGPDY